MNDMDLVEEELALKEKPQQKSTLKKDWPLHSNKENAPTQENTENCLSHLAEMILNAADIDHARIEQLKQEIATGSYEISSHLIAKRMLAFST